MVQSAMLLALLLLAPPPPAQATPGDPRVGETFQIVRTSESARQSAVGSATSRDSDALVERVVAVGSTGVELEYDLPANARAGDRASAWQFPARVLRSRAGRLELRNGAELKTRLDDWLKGANLPRTACGHWIFTWNAFRIECDPQSVITTIAAFDLGHDALAEGQSYRDPQARGTAPLKPKSGGNGFMVELAIDPDAVRRERAENDIAVAEISRQPITRAEAVRKHAGEAISGTITITFDTNAAGYALRRTKVTSLTIKSAEGTGETVRLTETLERRAIRRAADPTSI